MQRPSPAQSFTKRVVTLDADYASEAYPADLDGDGDVDIAAVSFPSLWAR